MTRKITNTCSHTLFMFFLSFISLKLVSLMFDVRVEKVITFHVRAHVHLHVGFPKLSIIGFDLRMIMTWPFFKLVYKSTFFKPTDTPE